MLTAMWGLMIHNCWPWSFPWPVSTFICGAPAGDGRWNWPLCCLYWAATGARLHPITPVSGRAETADFGAMESGVYGAPSQQVFGTGLQGSIDSAGARRIGAAARRNQSGRRRGVEGGVSEKSLRNGEHLGFIVTAKALLGPLRSFALERMRKRSPAEATGGILVRIREAK